MKKSLILFGVLVLGVTAIVVVNKSSRDSDKLQAWNIYKGEVGEYAVEIDESNRGHGFSRIVHLRPKGSPSYVGITGHDYDDDGKWDRVFYCGYPESVNGCNSFCITRSGERVWEPCPADKDRLQPFLLGEVIFAEEQLDKAMASVHRVQFRVSTLEDWRKKNG